MAFASGFGEPKVDGMIEVVSPVPLHLPQFVEHAPSFVARLERDIRGDDLRRFSREEFLVYADLRDAAALLRTGDRSALNAAFDAMRRAVRELRAGREGCRSSALGKWMPSFRAFVRRWESETARPDFDPYPEEERPGLEAPALAAPDRGGGVIVHLPIHWRGPRGAARNRVFETTSSARSLPISVPEISGDEAVEFCRMQAGWDAARGQVVSTRWYGGLFLRPSWDVGAASRLTGADIGESFRDGTLLRQWIGADEAYVRDGGKVANRDAPWRPTAGQVPGGRRPLERIAAVTRWVRGGARSSTAWPTNAVTSRSYSRRACRGERRSTRPCRMRDGPSC